MPKSLCKSCGLSSWLDEDSLCFRCRIPGNLGELKKQIEKLEDRLSKLEVLAEVFFQ